MKTTFLFFSAQYLPTTGGVERYTFNLAEKLISQGHTVIVVTSALKNLPAHETDEHGIEIFRLPVWPFMNGRLPLLRPGKEFCQLAKKIWARRIDHCVINTYFYPLSMYAASQIHQRKIPAIIINHGSAWLMTGNYVLELAGKIYERFAAKLCNHYCNRFYGVSAAAKDWLKTFSISSQGTITNAIDPPGVIAEANLHLDWRRQLSLPEDAKIIAFIGRMIPEKGTQQMISAMELIRRSHPNAYLLMAGTGPLFDKFQSNAPEGVFLLGNQSYPDVLALLSQADIFCLPSRSEGFACTVLEAAAMGCPIITTATGDSPQLLAGGRYGVLLPDAEPSTICNACIQALENPIWCQNAAALTKKQLLENYTWDTSVTQLYRAFDI